MIKQAVLTDGKGNILTLTSPTQDSIIQMNLNGSTFEVTAEQILDACEAVTEKCQTFNDIMEGRNGRN